MAYCKKACIMQDFFEVQFKKGLNIMQAIPKMHD